MLGGDFNAANIDWDTGIVPDSTDNRLMKEKLVTVLAEAGLTQMQRDPTRGQNLLDLFCCNKPSLVKSCISIPGISDHSIVLTDCNLKTPITNKPQRRVYRWSKADWHEIKGLTTTFAESFLALANSRSVNDNYLVFRKFMEGLLKTDIPSKLTGSRHNLPWINTDPSSPAFQPKVYSTPTSTFPGSQALNTFSTPSFGPPTFSSIVTPDLDPSSIATPTENSSDGSTVPYSESTVPRKDNNWRTLVIKANSIANKKAELAAIAEYCDPDLMLVSETKLGPDILNGEFVPEGYMGRFRKDRKRGAGGVMIITKECYKIVDADITVQNENESVWAIITLKDLSKLVIGSFYRPPDKGIQPLVDLEM